MLACWCVAVTTRSSTGLLAKATMSPSSSSIWTSSSPAGRPGRASPQAPPLQTLLLPRWPAPPAPPCPSALGRPPGPPPVLQRPQGSAPQALLGGAAASAPRGAAALAPLSWPKTTAIAALARASCGALSPATSIMATLVTALLLPLWPSTTSFDSSAPGGTPATEPGPAKGARFVGVSSSRRRALPGRGRDTGTRGWRLPMELGFMRCTFVRPADVAKSRPSAGRF